MSIVFQYKLAILGGNSEILQSVRNEVPLERVGEREAERERERERGREREREREDEKQHHGLLVQQDAELLRGQGGEDSCARTGQRRKNHHSVYVQRMSCVLARRRKPREVCAPVPVPVLTRDRCTVAAPPPMRLSARTRHSKTRALTRTDRLQVGEVVSTIPTIGFNVETVQHKNIKFQVWDLGGQTSIRPYWRCYYPNTQVRLQSAADFPPSPTTARRKRANEARPQATAH